MLDAPTVLSTMYAKSRPCHLNSRARRTPGVLRCLGLAVAFGCQTGASNGPETAAPPIPTAAAATSQSGLKLPGRVPATHLKLVRALPIDRWDNFQPSGLLWHEGRLLTVSDKHDGTIFELLIGPEVASVRPYITVQLPLDAGEYDFEGLASDGQGGLLIACEEQLRILKIDAQHDASWFTPPLAEFGRRAGLFQLHNAAIEGVALLPEGELLIAAERSDRGLIELPAPFDLRTAQAWNMRVSRFAMPGVRTPDFSDLTIFNGELFALLRSGHLVVRMQRSATGWQEGHAWTFADVENDTRYAYVDREYGVSEGLAMDETFVYVALDNNGDGRLSRVEDVRPQLLIFQRPD